MLDDEEWMGTNHEPDDLIEEHVVHDDVWPKQQLPKDHTNAATPSIVLSSGEIPDEIEVEVDEVSLQNIGSTSLTELNCILHSMAIWPTRTSKRCSSSALRKRRCLLVATLLFLAAFLMVIVIAIPVVTKTQAAQVLSIHTLNGPKPADETEEDFDQVVSTIAPPTSSTNSFSEEAGFFTSSVKDQSENANKETNTSSSTSMPEIDYVSAPPSKMGLNTDPNTGEEVLDVESSLNSASFPDNIAESQSTPSVSVANNGNMDQNTGEVYKVPILEISSTIANVASSANLHSIQDADSNDIALFPMSTVDPTSHVSVDDPTITHSSTSAETVTNDNNPIDGLISAYISSDEASRESQWLSAHNIRRKQWHQDNNVSYVPLRWSMELVSNAFTWANVLIEQEYDTLELYHDKNAQEGENLAMNCGSGSWSKMRPPDNILSRWVEEEVGLSPPDNLHLTQVLWRATTRVGCAEASREYGNGRTCHVQVCRYLRMGNCNMGKYDDWSIPMLLDESPC